MVIDWHLDEDLSLTELQYRRVGRLAWQEATGVSHFQFPFSADWVVYRAHLKGLDPGSSYEFRFGPGSRSYSFRTMPTTAEQPIRIALGGDTMYIKSNMDGMNRTIMQYDPDLIVWGGDLAYANGVASGLSRWYSWFDSIQETLITPEGRVIPIVVTIGNHEVDGGFYWGITGYTQTDAGRLTGAPYYYQIFAMPGQPGWGVLDFGDYMSIVLLDTDHTNPIEGAQTEWLAATLAERADVPHLIPVYHTPAWPSVRPFEGGSSARVRNLWVPLFEQNGVRVAFEHHDHAYKRTVPIRGNRDTPDGIVYIGDGAWGVPARTVKDVESTWYLTRAESTLHGIIMTIQEEEQHFLVISKDGRVIDEFESAPRPQAAAGVIE